MLETSFGLLFFQKAPRNKQERMRYIHVRITVDGIPKEYSTKRKWDRDRWNQETGRPIGNKEDARELNLFLDTITTKVYQAKTELIQNDMSITTDNIMDMLKGKSLAKNKVLEEFQLHNDNMLELVEKGEYADGTHEKYETTKNHVKEFIQAKYNRDDLEFRQLNHEFIVDFDFWLRTKKNTNNNTTVKYISLFKKIVLLAVAKQYIKGDPFKAFRKRRTKLKKRPLNEAQLRLLENKVFDVERLSQVRDIFIFQCYTGLAYADVFKLKKKDIVTGIDGGMWIADYRRKTVKSGASIDIPLLPTALKLMENTRTTLCA